MKTPRPNILPFILFTLLLCGGNALRAQGTAFTYQGRLNHIGGPANGVYDLRFTLYDAASAGGIVGTAITNAATSVSDGLFTTTLDFGPGVFDGNARWLEIGVKSNGVAGTHTPLAPRQPLTATPYAIHSSNASVAASVAAGGVTSAALADGAVTATKIAPGSVSQLGAPDGSPLNALSVDTNGFVGLGTSAPLVGLHLATGPQMYDGQWRFRIKDGATGYTNLGYVVGVATSGTLAVAAAYEDSAVTVLNLSNPSSPVKQSELRDGVNGFNDLGGAWAVALSSNLLAVTAYSDNAVTLVDLSSPTNPVLRATLKNGVGGFNELSGATAVALRGSLLAVAGNNAVTLVDVSNPAAPILRAEMKDGVGGFDYLGAPVSIAFSSNLLAVVAFQDQAVNLIDVSNPAAPVLLSTIREGVGGFGYIGQLQGLAFSGNTLAFGSWSSGVAFFADVSNPSAPIQKSAVGIGAGVRSMAFWGNLLAAAIGDGNNVTLIDVSDAAAPVVRGVIPDIESTTAFGNGIVTLAFTSSGYLFVGSAFNSAIGLLNFSTHQNTLSSDGWVGFGTSLPQAPLHVLGSVLVENAAVVSLQGNQVELGLRASASGSFATAIGTDARAEGNFSVVSGGAGNRVVVGATDASIGGGRENINAAVGATISGGDRNTIFANANYASIGGGRQNSALGQSSTVAGGFNNHSAGSVSFIGGGEGNTNGSPYSVIAGGLRNWLQPNTTLSAIGGGWGNTIQSGADESVIAGGNAGLIQSGGRESFIGGGYANTIGSNAIAAFIGGGAFNTNGGYVGTIGGGERNFISGAHAVIAGGVGNVNAGNRSSIAGGEANSISNTAPHAVIAGGIGNQSDAGASFIGGGSYNVNKGPGAFIGGGIANRAENFDAVIGGGAANVNAGYRSSIGGGEGNSIFAFGSHSTIGGGAYNAVRTNAFSSTIGGGVQNIISRDAFNSTISGGYTNIIETNAVASTIAGGTFNVIGPSAFLGTIGGGTANNNSGPYATIGGGYGNLARGNSSTVGGGRLNSATGQNATVPGGALSDALGDYSFASGRRAKASHPGAFVWADSTDADFASTANDQFSIRAGGGVRLVTSGTGMTLDGQPVLSGTVSSAQLANGSVTAAKIPTGQVVKSLNSLMDNVTLTAGTNVTITPSGNTLQIAATFTGPISDSQLSSNIVRLNAPAAFTGPVSFSNATGTFSGNGAGITNVNLTANSGGAISLTDNFVLASSPVAGYQQFSVTAADVNGDGKPDLITHYGGFYSSQGYLSVLTNNGSGGFVFASGLPTGINPRGSVIAADVNGDTRMDLISVSQATVWVHTNNGSGSFALSASHLVVGPGDVVAADMNGDGRLDLITVGDDAIGGGGTLSVLTNNGSGFFALAQAPAVGDQPIAVAAADVNGDSRVDVISAYYNAATLSVFTNTGSGSLVLASSPVVSSVAGFFTKFTAADANGDGKVDLIYPNYGANTLSVLTNNGSGGFALASSPGAGAGPVSISAADVNADGKVDLISANQGANTLSVLTNNGTGSFGLAASPAVGSFPSSVAAADVNGDARVDLISANYGGGGPLSVLFNTPVFSGAFSGNGAGLTSLNAANLIGSVPPASLTSVPASSLTGSVPPSSLTSVPAESLTGTIADARLSANVALLNANQTFTGNNSFSSALGLGTANPAAKLHLYSTDNPTTFRIQSTGTPGFGRIEFVSNPQGDANEWRPGYIQSLDVGGFTGGLGFFVNGTGAGSKFGDVEVMRVVNGNVAVAPPAVVSFGAQTRQMLNLFNTDYGIGIQSGTLYSRVDSGGIGFNWYKGGVHNDGAGNAGGGATLMSLSTAGLIVNGVFVSTSDRNAKENFAPVDAKEILAKVAALPISKWNFKQDARTPHVGPMAQDFHAAFGLGTDDKHIATVDADGVALAAIQGLNQRLTEELEQKQTEITKLKQRLERLERLMNHNNGDAK